MKPLNWSRVGVTPVDGTTAKDYDSPLHRLYHDRNWFVASAPANQSDDDPVLMIALYKSADEAKAACDRHIELHPGAWTLTGYFFPADQESFTTPSSDGADLYGDEMHYLYRYSEAIPCMIRELAAAGAENTIHFHEIDG